MSDFVQADQLIGSRYRLTEKDIDQLPYSGVYVWRAIDATLKISVRIILLDPKNPHFSEVLDAARRCSLFDDPHNVKILVVGSDSDYGWIVTEVPLGMPLSYRLHGEGFPPEQAKALVGETARLITSATSQGIRHLDVKPSDVRIDDQGQVFIDGLGIHAALLGIRTDTVMPHELDRKEATSLTRLYAQLLSGEDKSDPNTLLSNLCHDDSLDPSLRYFFEKAERGAGALSASDVIRNLGSWEDVDVKELPAIPGMQRGDVSAEDMDAELGIPYEPAILSVPKWPSARPVEKVATVNDSPVEETLVEEENPANDVVEDNEASNENTLEQGNETAQPTDGVEDAPVERNELSELNEPSDTAVITETVAEDESVEEETAASAKKENFLKDMAEKTSQKSKKLSEKTASGIASVAGSKAIRSAVTSLGRQMDKVSDVPEGGGARRYNTSWLFIMISLGMVIVAGVVATAFFFSTPKVKSVTQGPTGPAIVQDDDNPVVDDRNKSSNNSLVESVELLNPQASKVPTSEGVQQDNPDTVANIADGDTSTVWETWWYPTPNYTAGKNGIGLRIKLKEALTIDNIYLQVNGAGGTIQWIEGNQSVPDNAHILDESAMSTATYLVPEHPVTTDTITLWIAELPKDKVKKNRAVIAEIDFNREISDTVRQSNKSS